MNQLAVAIRNFSDDRKDSERFSLTPLELIALRSIGSIVKMPPDALATYLEQEGEPTEWLIVP